MSKKNRTRLKKFSAFMLVFSILIGSLINVSPLYAEEGNFNNQYDQKEIFDVPTESVESKDATEESVVTEKTEEDLSEGDVTLDKGAGDIVDDQNEDSIPDIDNSNDENGIIEDEIIEDLPEEPVKEDSLINTSVQAKVYTDSSYLIRKYDSKITLSGFLPKNATVKAYEAKVEVGDATEKLLVAYDIEIFDKDGNIFEPAEGNPIKVDIKNKKITDAKEINVYHMEDENAPEEKLEENKKVLDTVTFEAKSFSVYAVTEKQTHTYIFEDLNTEGAEEKVYKQIIKDDEKLYEPKAPEIENKKFVGWEVFEGETSVGTLAFVEGFASSIVTPITENKEYTVRAKYEDVVYVHFMDGRTDEARVFTTLEGKPGEPIDISGVNLPLGSTEAVTGWYENSDLSGQAVSDPYTTKTSIKLYPKIESGHYLYFQTSGGSYVKPQFVPANGTTTSPANPTRPGFTFSYWSESENGSAYTFGQSLSADKTLYAVWQGTPVKYNVIIWKQSVNDDKNATEKTYDFAEAIERTANAGDSVNSTINDRRKSYTGFHYAKADTYVEVLGDGTTVVNVYYDRNLLTINFRYGYYISEMQGLYGQTLAQNGYTWPEGRWTESNSAILTFLDSFIFDDLSAYRTNYDKDTLDLRYNNPTSGYYYRHYKENLDGSYSTTPNNTSTTSSIGNFTLTNKYTGFTVSYYRIGDSGDFTAGGPGLSVARGRNNLYIRYTRNSYNLAFYNHQEIDKKISTKYEAPLSGQNYTPTKPASLPAEYEFQGWYKDSTFTQPFNFASEKMPANNLMIYAKWAAPEVKAIVHLGLSDSSGTNELELEYNKPLNQALLPTVKDNDGNVVFSGSQKEITLPENHKWIGWATKEGSSYINYNFNTLVLSDLELYPYSISNEKLTVTYKNNYPKFEAIDKNQYAENAYAEVLSFDSQNLNKVGYSFIGWKNSLDGKIYMPGDKVQVTENLVLEAQWQEIKDTTNLEYIDPLGQAPDKLENLLINQKVKLASPTAQTGYRFVAWKSEDGKYYKAGTDVIVDNEMVENNTNKLTAVWEEEVVVNKVWIGDKAKSDIEISITGAPSSKEITRISNDSSEIYKLNETSTKTLSSTESKVSFWYEVEFDANGNKIDRKYTASEQVPEGYTAVYKDQESKNITITNYPEIKVTIKKKVTGNMGDTDKKFSFDINGTTSLLAHGDSTEVTLKYGEKLSVSETNEDYVVSIVWDYGTKNGSQFNFTYDENFEGQDFTVTYTNDKTVAIPTGINTNNAPMLAVMVTFIAAGSMLLIRRRNLEI